MLKFNRLSKTFRTVIGAMILAMIVPITALAQRRWVVVRPHRSRIVVYNYQPRPYVVYQRPYYGYRTYNYSYPQSYYGYQPYTYSEPYYSNYSYRYSQPYFANRYTYSYANPTYYYDGNAYRRHRHNRVRVGIWGR